MTNVAIFVSGGGTNCEAIIRHFAGSQDVKISLVLSNRADAYALVRAQNLGIPTIVVPKKQFNDGAHEAVRHRFHRTRRLPARRP